MIEVEAAAAVSETDEFVSCDDGEKNFLNTLGEQHRKKLSMDIEAAIKMENGPQAPLSTKAGAGLRRGTTKVPKLNMDDFLLDTVAEKQGVGTPPSSRVDTGPMHLATLHESDYDGD